MNIETQCVNAIRVLSADMVQKAKSGHPGMPLGAAPIAYELFAHQMTHNPKNPKWANRDRFVLSSGHASAMLYSLLHLFGYGLTLDDLKKFRQDGSLTPGHPEYGLTPGVEATTGPLGSGIGMAVGMAMAEANLAKIFNKPDFPIIDHYTFVLCGDGCLMEGISSEALSFAGTLGLSKLIVLYDSNRISIEGSTDLAFTEDVAARVAAFGFQTLTVEDGNNLDEISAAIAEAKADKTRPSFITIKTHIGYGSPKQDSASCHGEPLGEENVIALKKNLGWDNPEATFNVPDDVCEHYRELAEVGARAEAEWNKLFADYIEKFPISEIVWENYYLLADLEEDDKKDLEKDPEKRFADFYLNSLVGETQESRTESEQPHVEPEQPHVEPEQPHVEPEQPHVEPEQPHVEPEQPHVEPEQSHVEPEQPHVEPEQPHVEPEQPHVEPEQPLTVEALCCAVDDKPQATRASSGNIINYLKDRIPNLIGGSADLGPSNKTVMKGAGDFGKDNYAGRNIHFGVREFAMSAIVNGMALHGGLKPFCATFFVFSDYLKPMMRLSSLMKLPVIYVFTHDSIGVGEDGPTHEPIEQLAMLRAQPNLNVFRPADATETAAGWFIAVTSKYTPTALILTRQNLPQLSGSGKQALKGGYVISEAAGDLQGIFIATGSEVSLAIEAQQLLADEKIFVRVVSMPCVELFEQQSDEYKESVLPKKIRARVAVEAAANFGWGSYVGLDGATVTMKSFGASAPAGVLFKKFGFTRENVARVMKSILEKIDGGDTD